MKVHGGAHRDATPVELLDATLHYDTDGVMREEHVFLGSHASADDAKVGSSKDPAVIDGALKAQAAWDELEAIRKARETDKPKVAPNNPKLGGGSKSPISMPAPYTGDMKQRYDSAMRTLMNE